MNKERVQTLAKTSWPYIETEKIDDDDADDDHVVAVVSIKKTRLKLYKFDMTLNIEALMNAYCKLQKNLISFISNKHCCF